MFVEMQTVFNVNVFHADCSCHRNFVFAATANLIMPVDLFLVFWGISPSDRFLSRNTKVVVRLSGYDKFDIHIDMCRKKLLRTDQNRYDYCQHELFGSKLSARWACLFFLRVRTVFISSKTKTVLISGTFSTAATFVPTFIIKGTPS